MKTHVIFFFFLSFIAFFIINSCDVDKLELTNPNNLTGETWFSTEAQVQSAVNAVYTNLQTRGLYQRHIYFAMDNMAYENLPNPAHEVDKLQYYWYNFDANHGGIAAYWASCYLGINKANFVINNADKIYRIDDAQLPIEKKDKFIGEAKFLRALYYFLLVTRFGDIPLITDGTEHRNGEPRSETIKVWEQIEADLLDAANKCLDRSEEELGRATSGAALALLGKAHLFQACASQNLSDYQAAKSALLKVTSSGGYQLEQQYFNNFMEETEHGVESIFEVEFNPSLGYSDRWSSDRDGTGYNECTFRGLEYGCFDWYSDRPSSDLLAEFEPGDPRINYCFYIPGDIPSASDPNVIIQNAVVYNQAKDTAIINPFEYFDGNTWVSEPRAGWRKYQNYYKQRRESSSYGAASGINMKVIRYADVLLMLAECEATLGNLDEAISLMNRIRARTDVNMPPYPTADYPISNLVEFMLALEHERKVELCGEQIRFNDLVRWRRLEEFVVKVWKLPWMEYNFQFDPNIHYLWPIPQAEIDLNPALTQADQNYGY